MYKYKIEVKICLSSTPHRPREKWLNESPMDAEQCLASMDRFINVPFNILISLVLLGIGSHPHLNAGTELLGQILMLPFLR